MIQSLWKIIWRILRELKIQLAYYLAVSLLGTHPKETRTLTQRDICIFTVIAALFTMAKSQGPLMYEWIKK